MLESGFTSAPDAVRHNVNSRIPCKLGCLIPACCTISWRSIDRIGSVTAPILFITGTADKTVPCWMSTALKDAAVSSKYTQLYEIPGGTHNRLWAFAPDYWTHVEEFLQNEVVIKPSSAASELVCKRL